MFFLVERTERVSLSPKYFKAGLRSEVMKRLRKQLEGRPAGDFGYTVLVTTMVSMSEGLLKDFTGEAEFKVRYLSLIFRPYPNEVVYAKVAEVNENGFNAEAGPVTIFVSKNSMPEDYKLRTSESEQYYETEDGELTIELKSMVRVRIINLRISISSENNSVVGTINDDYLGPIE